NFFRKICTRSRANSMPCSITWLRATGRSSWCWPDATDAPRDTHVRRTGAASVTRSALPGFAIALLLLVAGLALAFTMGPYPVGLGDVFDVLFAKLTGQAAHVPSAVESVIMQVRGPRVLAAALIGAALAVAGTAFQGLFRNPLVSPDILGASSGAALGAVIGIYFSLGVLAIQGIAFAGGLAAGRPPFPIPS